ncbi:hypothetical protein [Phormidium sp. FACHB-1136]|uniref:hypothetical protein n=1 Tax=Phormidium sp. FACHB-1136 TaxID=2692848 RepID=UPI001682A454|nr:hypothetical protein [Phormidium sp. FACHB-1136]MBD2424999.1 hypothetical protein [Phormidium sp. FACHB-1136]
MPNDKSHQSINISGSQLKNNQFGQSGRDLTQNQRNSDDIQAEIRLEDIIALFNQLKDLINSAEMPPEKASRSLSYVEIAEEEIKGQEGNKDFAAANLKRLVSTLENTDKAMESSQNILEKAKPLLMPIFKYLGLAAGTFL